MWPSLISAAAESCVPEHRPRTTGGGVDTVPPLLGFVGEVFVPALQTGAQLSGDLASHLSGAEVVAVLPVAVALHDHPECLPPGRGGGCAGAALLQGRVEVLPVDRERG